MIALPFYVPLVFSCLYLRICWLASVHWAFRVMLAEAGARWVSGTVSHALLHLPYTGRETSGSWRARVSSCLSTMSFPTLGLTCGRRSRIPLSNQAMLGARKQIESLSIRTFRVHSTVLVVHQLVSFSRSCSLLMKVDLEHCHVAKDNRCMWQIQLLLSKF